VSETVRSCEACQRSKIVTTPTKEEIIQISAKEPFEKVYIDVCGPFKETLRKKKYVVATVDKFSRYVSLMAVAKQDEETLRDTIMNYWILRFGAPKEMHVDCGKAFESIAMRRMTDSMGIRLCFSRPYHHNTNGSMERQFRTVRDLINVTLQGIRQTDWAAIIPEVEFTLNSTLQKSLNKSPAEIIFVRILSTERWVSNDKICQDDKTQATCKPTKRKFQM